MSKEIEIKKEDQNVELNESEMSKIQVEEAVQTANAVNAEYENLNDADKEEFVKTLASSINEENAGDVEAAINSFITNGNEKSAILTSLPIWLVETKFNEMKGPFSLGELVPLKKVINGTLTQFYSDYFNADNAKAWDDVTIDDYNPDGSIQVSELWAARTNIHKSFKIIDTLLNDVVPSIGLFVALVNSIKMNIAYPIAEIMTKIALQGILKPSKTAGDYEATLAYDGATQADIVVELTTDGSGTEGEKEIIINLMEQIKSLSTPSRLNRQGTNMSVWKPTGLTQDIRVALSDFKIIVSKEIWARIRAYYSGVYNFDKLLDEGVFVVLDYNKTFGEYGSVTGLTRFDMFVVEKGALSIIQHFDSTKIVDTPKLYKAMHAYTRVGIALDKNKTNYRIHFKPKTAE